jgi:hypothetical protein
MLNFFVSYLFLIFIQYVIYTLMKKINKIKFNNRSCIDEILTIIYIIIWFGCINLNISFLSKFLFEDYNFNCYQFIYAIIIINIYRLFFVKSNII